MNAIQKVDIDFISETVLSSQEAISEVLESLSGTPDNVSIDNANIDIIAHLENIGVISGMSNLKGLNAVCDQLGVQVLNNPLSDVNESQVLQEKIDAWLMDVLLYLDDWKSTENVDLLINNLSIDAGDIRKQLLQDIDFFNNSSLITIDTELDDCVEDGLDESVDNDSVEGIMALFCNELQEFKLQITELTGKITGTNQAESQEASAAYIEFIERIYITSDELNLLGISQVIKFVIKNINLYMQAEPTSRNEISAVLIGWPQAVIDHLQSPEDDQLCLAVLTYLEYEAWPEPLKYSETRELIDGLTHQLELTGDYEVEARSVTALAEDVQLSISKDISQQLHDAFFAEAPSHAEELSRNISNIITGIDVLENTRAAQRISHTLKGSANLIGTKGIANISHHLEDIFEYLVKQSFPPPSHLAYTLQEAADTIEVMIESLQGQVSEPDDALRILQDVLNWANKIDNGELTTDSTGRTDTAENSPSNMIDAEIDEPLTHDSQPLIQTDLLRVPRDTIDQIFNLIGETSIAIGQIQEQLKRMHERGDDMRKQEKTLQSRRFELENLVSIRSMANQQKRQTVDAEDANFDSLEMDRYDEFYGATHTFIEAVSDAREASRDVNANIMELDGLFLKQQRLNRTLQDLVMTTRMEPVKTIVARLQRTVRQACRATDKQVELVIEGEALLMDVDVLNQLADPLMHLLRNAVDHGIEKPQQRLAVGKPESGNILLKFYQAGNSIKVSCSDDGGGLDYEKIRWTAIDKNIITPQEEVDNKKIARFILHSGFSTRDKATQISGRGVGMDVVYTAIQNLKGSLDIVDNEDAGTQFNLSVPITLLTSHSILVRTQDDRYAIPTAMLDQILPPGTGQFSSLNGKLTYQLNKEVYTARSLSQLLGVPVENKSIDSNDASTVLLVHFNSEIVAVTVDYVVSSYDLVVKNLGRYVKKVPGITGVALLGDGGVVPVLDVAGLLSLQNADGQNIIQFNKKSAPQAAKRVKVLIVDDSLSVRKSLSQLVQDAGYEPMLARDGIEALEAMQKVIPDIILTDLEMPRMNGLELATHVRSIPDTNNIPIMMITSRTMLKHQEQASKAGVDEYITKPFSEDELVEKLRMVLHG